MSDNTPLDPFGGFNMADMPNIIRGSIQSWSLNTEDKGKKGFSNWVINMVNLFEKYNFFSSPPPVPKDTPFDNMETPDDAKRIGAALSKINLILSTECSTNEALGRDFVLALTQLASDMDTQERDLGKYMREGWNAHRQSIGNNETM